MQRERERDRQTERERERERENPFGRQILMRKKKKSDIDQATNKGN